MLAPTVAGALGLCFSGILWSVSSWRLVFHLSGCCPCTRNRSLIGPRDFLTPRRVFHILLWIAMTVESLAYADLSRVMPLSSDSEYAEKVGHVLLDTIGRAIFEFLAFSLVTVLWFRTAAEAQAVRTGRSLILDVFPNLLIASSTILTVCSIWESFDVLGKQENLISYQSQSWVYRLFLFVESMSWLVHTLLVATCVGITANSILRLSAFPQTGTITRAVLLLKPLLPMGLCGVFYGTRAMWLFVKFVRLMHTKRATQFTASWWVGFVWIPTIVPSAMVLYSARKRDQLPVSEEDERDIALLPTPVPPAEAFMAFRRVSDGADYSPLAPRCITAATPEDVFRSLTEGDDDV